MKRAFCVLGALSNNRSLATADAKMKLLSDFKQFKFRAPSYTELPIDENPEYNVPVAVKNAVFSKVPVEPLTGNIHLVCASEDALTDLFDLDPQVAETQKFIDFVAGIYLPEGGLTVCHRYGGYQFGFWADQLGDGRAHILGEYVNSKGEIWQPQLKGSGETPYSRFGDGRAVLRSSIREMVASEACHHLGIPTTRAAALVVSDEHKVWRDKSYSGTARQERAAVVLRVAAAWYRLGSIEILLKRKEPDTMKTLVDYIIKLHFPDTPDDDEKYLKWYADVAHRNLDMVATWQGYGFTHGVLNTDNVSVLGLTIDYGPFGFIDHYNRHYVPNSSDDMGRYAYYRQPEIILWNIEKFAEALAPIFSEEQLQKMRDMKSEFEAYLNRKILSTYLLKLGLKEIQDGDHSLTEDLLQLMQDTTADFTATFRQLAEVDPKDLVENSVLETQWALNKVRESRNWEKWVQRYRERLNKENVSGEERRQRMVKVNPVYIPRNWIMQDAIKEAEQNDFEKVRFLMKLFRKPFEVNEEAEKLGYSAQPPSWSYGLKLSCSS